MANAKRSQLRVQAQLEAEKKIAQSCQQLSPKMLREMRDRDPHFDRLDAGVDRRN